MQTENGSSYWVGFDLGGTKMLSVVYDSDFNDLGRERKKQMVTKVKKLVSSES